MSRRWQKSNLDQKKVFAINYPLVDIYFHPKSNIVSTKDMIFRYIHHHYNSDDLDFHLELQHQGIHNQTRVHSLTLASQNN